MALDHDSGLGCTGCGLTVEPGAALEDRCACGDSAGDHGPGHEGGGECRVCSCPVFEWDGSLSCPACLSELELDDSPHRSAPHRSARHRSARHAA